MVRRTVDETLFEKQNIELLVAQTMRRPAPTVEESLLFAGAASNERAAPSTPAATGRANPAARSQPDLSQNTRPFTDMACPWSACRAASRNPACRLAFKSVVPGLPRFMSLHSFMLAKKRPIGTTEDRHCSRTPKCLHCPRPRTRPERKRCRHPRDVRWFPEGWARLGQ